MQNPESTQFGEQTVTPEEKTGLVRGVFDSVAGNYDIMNDLMSGGLHRLWKRAFIGMLRPRADMTLLDVAGGTGDIAFLFRKKGGGETIVCDINAEMLAVGRDRAIDRAIVEGVTWVCGDAERLPLPDRSVDAVTIAFGLRNVTDKLAALKDMRRVLRPGGTFQCLEFGTVSIPLLGAAYDRYSFSILPRIGEFVTKDRESYQYLVESIRQFPPQAELADMMEQAGFERVSWRDMSGGIVAIHAGWRI